MARTDDIRNIKKIREMDVYKDDWTTGDLMFMSDEQILKATHSTFIQLISGIMKLKKKFGAKPFLDDVVRKEVANSIVKESQRRFFDEEIIPIK